ncbi:MAG: hypothetical protein WAX14_19110 [Rhodococcus sp. (in: high G+C Gram-positive bacteria)]|uniref:hypothetical protein n=1 Tax=Rhodococcus sp. TaxID=1831 RepID=UPI003BB6FF1E
MSKRTECGARARQVIRRLRTDTNAAPAVITTALYQYLPPVDEDSVEEVGEVRKLLIFSDSRQSAVFAAPSIQYAVDRFTRCDCGIETSCYGCLRSFRNERHHEQLSREGALSTLPNSRSSRPVRSFTELVCTSQSVVELLLELSLRGVVKPELGVDLGVNYWPVDAVWPDVRIVLVDGDDAERDADLTEEGCTVVNVDDTDADRVVSLLPAV